MQNKCLIIFQLTCYLWKLKLWLTGWNNLVQSLKFQLQITCHLIWFPDWPDYVPSAKHPKLWNAQMQVSAFMQRLRVPNCSVFQQNHQRQDAPPPLKVSPLLFFSVIVVNFGAKNSSATSIQRCFFLLLTNLFTRNLITRIVDLHPEYSNDSYVVDNLLVLHIYFRFRLLLQFCNFNFSRHLHFMRNERDELYGFVAIVSNIGEEWERSQLIFDQSKTTQGAASYKNMNIKTTL